MRSTKAVAGSYLPAMVRELTLGVNEVCAQHRAQLDGPRADDHFAASIDFLSLVRLLVVADVWVDYRLLYEPNFDNLCTDQGLSKLDESMLNIVALCDMKKWKFSESKSVTTMLLDGITAADWRSTTLP